MSGPRGHSPSQPPTEGSFGLICAQVPMWRGVPSGGFVPMAHPGCSQAGIISPRPRVEMRSAVSSGLSPVSPLATDPSGHKLFRLGNPTVPGPTFCPELHLEAQPVPPKEADCPSARRATALSLSVRPLWHWIQQKGDPRHPQTTHTSPVTWTLPSSQLLVRATQCPCQPAGLG